METGRGEESRWNGEIDVLFDGGGRDAVAVVCMNCSVRSLLAFMFWGCRVNGSNAFQTSRPRRRPVTGREASNGAQPSVGFFHCDLPPAALSSSRSP